MLIRDLERMLWETYNDWNHLLVNPRIERTKNTLSWQQYESTFLPELVSGGDIVTLAELGQYTFQVIADGALFQLYYGFADNGKSIHEAKLAYYAVSQSEFGGYDDSDIDQQHRELPLEGMPTDAEEPDVTPLDIEEEAPQRAIASTNMGPSESVDTSPTWVRLDYQPAHENGILHSCCHLHLSTFPKARLIVRGLPTPSQFVEFIFHLNYPVEFASHRLDGNGQYRNLERARDRQRPIISMDDDSPSTWLTHLRIAGA